MATKSYGELLKDPRWQRKRLEILERDGWACKLCGSGGKTLHVHHRYYLKGKLPWEYGPDALVTLCEDCHETATHERRAFDESCRALGEFDYELIRGFVDVNTALIDRRPLGPGTSYEYFHGAGLALGVSAEELMGIADEFVVVASAAIEELSNRDIERRRINRIAFEQARRNCDSGK